MYLMWIKSSLTYFLTASFLWWLTVSIYFTYWLSFPSLLSSDSTLPRLPSAPSPPTPHILLLKKLHSLSITQLKLHNLHTLHSPSAHLPPRMPFSDVFGVWGLLELLFKECLVWTLTWRVFLGYKNKLHWEKVHCPVPATYRSRCGPK